MFHTISERLIEYAVKNNILDAEKTEEYIYGLEISLSVSVSYISVLIIGMIMGMFAESALFLLLFISVRRFAGGFHFSSQIACYISTCSICALALLAIKYCADSVMIYSIMMIISSIIVLVFSPVPAIEKPLDEKEKIVYGRIARIMIVFISVMYAVLCLFRHTYITKIISVTICIVAIFSILGKIKQKLYESKKAVS